MSNSSISQPAARTYSVVDLVAAATEGRIRIPEFQRPLRWQWQDVQRLFDSIVKGYPIGNLLLWKRQAPAKQVKLGALMIKARQFEDGWWVVDGQQRLTSLANALTAEGAIDERFCLAYDLKKETFVRPNKEEDGFVIPLPILFDLQQLIRWFTKDHPEASEKLDEASRVTRAIREYQVPAYLVDKDDEGTLRDIFDRMNNYGKRLSLADVFSALHPGKSSAGEPTSYFQRIAESIHAERGFGILDDDNIMRAILARRGGNVTRDIRIEFSDHAQATRDFGGESPDIAYREGELALLRAVAFLQEDAGVPHFAFLPYRYLLVVLARFFAHYPNPQPRNRELLRRWFWRAAMIGPGPFSSSWTIAGRTLATRISANDENNAVQALLSSPIDRELHLPKLTGFRTNSAQGRIVMAALWALDPRSPWTGKKYDRHELAEAIQADGTLANIAQRFFIREPEGHQASAANRVIVLEQELPESISASFINRPITRNTPESDFLSSHAVSADSIQLLSQGNKGVFLEKRQSDLEDILKNFLERMSGAHLEDTPPLDSFNFDEMDDDSDDTLM